MNDIKVFITVEREKNDLKSKVTIAQCLKLEETLALNNVPCQIKITSLPRRKGFRPALELIDIEKNGGE